MEKSSNQVKIIAVIGLLAFAITMFILAFSGVLDNAEQKAVIESNTNAQTTSTAPSTKADTGTTGSTKSQTTNSQTTPFNDFPININTANEEQLQNIPGIGYAKAVEIVNYRKEHGKFTDAEQLLNVYGIGESTLEKIYGYICL